MFWTETVESFKQVNGLLLSNILGENRIVQSNILDESRILILNISEEKSCIFKYSRKEDIIKYFRRKYIMLSVTVFKEENSLA